MRDPLQVEQGSNELLYDGENQYLGQSPFDEYIEYKQDDCMNQKDLHIKLDPVQCVVNKDTLESQKQKVKDALQQIYKKASQSQIQEDENEPEFEQDK